MTVLCYANTQTHIKIVCNAFYAICRAISVHCCCCGYHPPAPPSAPPIDQQSSCQLLLQRPVLPFHSTEQGHHSVMVIRMANVVELPGFSPWPRGRQEAYLKWNGGKVLLWNIRKHRRKSSAFKYKTGEQQREQQRLGVWEKFLKWGTRWKTGLTGLLDTSPTARKQRRAGRKLK